MLPVCDYKPSYVVNKEMAANEAITGGFVSMKNFHFNLTASWRIQTTLSFQGFELNLSLGKLSVSFPNKERHFRPTLQHCSLGQFGWPLALMTDVSI